MPVRFKGDSEYHENFKWISSPKSATFSPTKQQQAVTAGLSSPQASQVQGFMDEPAILRKKKPIPLVTTSTTKMFDEELVVPDDYMLLGSQEKFTTNVPYKDYLTKNRSRVLGTTYVTPSKPVDFEQLQASPSKPLAKINFDTGAPKRQVAKEQPPVEVEGKAKPVNLSKTRVIAKEPAIPVSPPHSSVSGSTSSTPRQMAKTKVIEKPKVSQPVPRQVQAEPYHPPNKSSTPVVETKAKSKQDPNVDDSYAMKYRAGIAPHRVSTKRKSEYAYKYDWKKPVESTPLLAAQQVVHNNNPQIAPYKVGLPKQSEYSKEFKPWKYKPVVSQDDAIAASRSLKKTIKGSKMRRTKSEMDLTPDRRPAAGSPSRIFHDNTRLTKSLNPQKPFFPHRRTVSWVTEYKSNFQPFSKFKYDQGAWHGAAPPHIKQQMNYETDGQLSTSNWTAEVRELREKAEEYRKRSNGTHFSRVHVGQLLSENSKLWDAVSVSSELSALDLEQSQATTSPPRKPSTKSPRQRTQSAQPALRSSEDKQKKDSAQARELKESSARKRLAWSSDGDRSTSPSDTARSIRSSSTPTVTSDHSYRTPSISSSAMNKQFVKQISTQNNERFSDGSGSTGNGRAQTPELTNSSVVHRHHLDITTPNRHGLLLSSPPRRSKQPESKERSPRVNQVRNSAEKGERVARDMSLEVGIPPANVNSKELLSPTYGKPTPDTHPLLNEEVAEPVDMILETRYVQSPQPKANMSALLEGAGMTYKVPQARQDDPWKAIGRKKREEDECSVTSQLSESMMSVISSTSSLANEVLDRAARRQKQFWGQKTKS